MTLAGKDDSVIGPADVDLAEGTTTIVYAWGSAEDDNLKLAVQTIDGMGGNPGRRPRRHGRPGRPRRRRRRSGCSVWASRVWSWPARGWGPVSAGRQKVHPPMTSR